MTELSDRLVTAAKAPDPRPALARVAGSDRHEVLRALASLQDGQLATAQAYALGLTPDAVRWLRTSGETMSLRRGVWRFRTAGGEPDAAVTAWLVCWPHAVISHASAAVHHNLPGVLPPAQPEVTVAHGLRIRHEGIAVHHSRCMERADRVTIGGVAYTTTARTVCDLADHAHPSRTLTLVDDAIASGVRRSWLHRRADATPSGSTDCSTPGTRLAGSPGPMSSIVPSTSHRR